MTTRSVLFMTFVAMGGAAGCKKATPVAPAGTVKDFAYKADARNFAVLAGNDGTTIKLADGSTASQLFGVPPDIETWWKFLCPDQAIPAGGVQVPVRGVKPITCKSQLGTFEIVYVNQTTTSAEDLKSAMRWVGANLENDSTLLLAYSGHGSETGSLYVTPESPWWPFGDILGEEPRRRNVRGARFYFFNDSCFSGKLVNDEGDKSSILVGGRTSASLDDGQILTPAVNDGYTGPSFRQSAGVEAADGLSLADTPAATAADAPLTAANQKATDALAKDVAKGPAFAQAIIFSASTRAQVAGDLGASKGGAFTSTLKEVFEFYFKNRVEGDQGTNPSLQRVFNDIAWRLQNRGPAEKRQVPQYRVAPDCVLQEKFFLTGKATTCTEAIGGTGAGTITETGTKPSPSPSVSPTSQPKAND